MNKKVIAWGISLMFASAMLSACSASGASAGGKSSSDVSSQIAEESSEGASDFDAVSVSEGLCEDMVQGDFAMTYILCSDNMRQGMTEEQLKAAWQQTIAPLGGFVRYGDSDFAHVDEFIVTESLLEFQNGSLVVRITYSGDGLIEGLYFLYPQQ